jgi:hypothetical protein
MSSFPSNKEETSSISFSLSALEDKSQTEPVTLKPFAFHHGCFHSAGLDSSRMYARLPLVLPTHPQ